MKRSRYKRIATTALISFLMAMNTLPVQVRADEELPQEEITEQAYEESEILTEEEPSEEYTPEPVDEQTVEVQVEPVEEAPEVVEEPVEEPAAEPVEESVEEEYEEPVENALGKADYPGEIIVESADNQHYYVDFNGFTVTVTTQPDAFEEKAVLSTSVLENDSEEYQTAEEALKESEQAYDGMLAFDIHFENAEGEEIEPNGKVTVKFTAKAEVLTDIAPDTVDASSIQILHIVETPEEERTAVAEVVADNSADTPDVNVVISDNAVEKVSANFDVESFSTFALTWNNGTESATIHFVELKDDGTFAELDDSIGLDTDAASVSLRATFPGGTTEGGTEWQYVYVSAYYSNTETASPPQDGIQILPTLNKAADGSWQYTINGSDTLKAPIQNGSHIYAVYKSAEPYPSTPASGSDASKVKPDSYKTVETHDDRTCTVVLDIIGHADIETIENGANVLLIYDRTSSMSKTMSNGQGGTTTRELAAHAAVKTLTELLEDKPVEMAAFAFDRVVHDPYSSGGSKWTTNLSDIYDFISTQGLAYPGTMGGENGGTNWEAALQQAGNVLATADGDPTYVIFLTDGNPSWCSTATGSPSDSTGNDDKYRLALVEGLKLDTKFPIYGILCANASDGPLLQTLMTDLAEEGHITNHILADDAQKVKEAFENIAGYIIENLGATNTTTNDGITSLSTSSATHGAAGAFKYYITPKDGERTEWTDAPAASYNPSTGVTWDLSSVGALQDGVTYSVEFIVWPSQDAFDLICDLNNGVKDYETLDADIKKQIIRTQNGTAAQDNHIYS